MKYLPIDKGLFVKNRSNFVSQLKPGSIAIFVSNDIYPTNADGTLPFRQNNDLFYLSGIDQEETILVLFPDAKSESLREILFIRETNEHIATWEGNKLTKTEASAASGIPTIYWSSQFKSVLNSLIFDCSSIYLNYNEHTRADKQVLSKEERFAKWCKKNYPLHTYERSAPILHKLRSIKSEIEIEQMKTAVNITEKAFRRVLNFVKPGVMEYEIEAEIAYEFLKNRSRGPAYQSIIASGANSCILHYVVNDQRCKDGDILLLDFGAEYANYAADLTRSIPVNGKYTSRQKDVYNAVLKVMKEAKKLLVAGNNFKTYNETVGKIVEEELIKLKLLDNKEVKNQDPANPLYRKYFMHGVSHYLGLDVHDVGSRNAIFENGMVFTVEPGIYIKEEGLGIRIENNILLSEKGPIDLMENIPIEADEIEELMNSGK
ncbi:X-Pro aminopeptidase [Sporocytophaga myxococcoides]|uniref:Xaa-Pro aminopeptidase n=1 Tax=Sporocytophaga myxococcoides TaxID=153721 RepID=A0A098L897_9BACT|nr:aminopeptidase P N-terminal domain-containing protein [Sporocytophaga myxococcoides]GAL82875.1 X-Pro aminopeptidase [Sporocytophaga myxococcoides]